MSTPAIVPGWATYLRVSDEDKQTPARSFAMQRRRIEERLVAEHDLPLHKEYKDLLSGTKANRKDYQQMLADAHQGKFSHLGLYRADRFGRNTIEGLQAATQLISLGVKIRIANMPSLRPEEPDGFFMFLIQMGMAQREVDVLAQRTSDGIEAKLRKGGWANKAPEGYVNKERQVGSNKYERWVEMHPTHIKPIREAWQLLLTGRYTLDEICEELHAAGYTRSTGLPWVWTDPKSAKRKTAKQRLQKFFHNPFYAGWVVSEKYGIKLGDVRGEWQAAVTTEQFKRGKVILHKHDYNKSRKKKHHYLLRNLLYVQIGERQYKLYGSTPSGRSKSYAYYISHTKPNGRGVCLQTQVVDKQIPGWLAGVAVDVDLLPEIRRVYQEQIKQHAGGDKESQRKQLRHRLNALKDEEARLARLLITEKISEEAYNKLRLEWQEKVLNLQMKLEELKFDATLYLDDLELALVLLSQIGVLYGRLDEKQQSTLLQILLKRLVIDLDGEIMDFELHAPFQYLHTLATDGAMEQGDFWEMLDFSNKVGLGKIFST